MPHFKHHAWTSQLDILFALCLGLVILVLGLGPLHHMYSLWQHSIMYWWDTLVPALFPALSIGVFVASRTRHDFPRFSAALLGLTGLPLMPLYMSSKSRSDPHNSVAISALWGNLYNPLIFPHTIPIIAVDILSLVTAICLEAMGALAHFPRMERNAKHRVGQVSPILQAMNLTTLIGGFLAITHTLDISATPILLLIDPVSVTIPAASFPVLTFYLLMNGLAFLCLGTLLADSQWVTFLKIRLMQMAMGSACGLIFWLVLPQFRPVGF